MRMWLAVAVGLLPTIAVAAPPVPPALDPEVSSPYSWKVAVRFDPHPLLDADFRRQVLAGIRVALQPPDGETWHAEVTDIATIPEDKRDPLLKAYLAKGWPALEAPEFRPLTGVKMHFLRISVNNTGLFRLESRQHDGNTGLTSPVTRTFETRDHQTVSRLAGMMLVRDFGPTGVVEKVPNQPEAVNVKFRAGLLPGLARFVQPGDILAVAAVVEQPRPRKPDAPKQPGSFRRTSDDAPPIRAGRPLAYLVLRVESQILDGSARCAVIEGSMAQRLTGGRGVVGYKCIKLGTTESAVRVKIQDANGGPPPGAGLLQVRATDKDFPLRSDARDSLEYRDGEFRTLRPMRNLACLVITVGTTRDARFPVPVFGEATQTIRLALNEADAARAALELDCESLRARAGEVRRDQTILLGAVGKMIQTGDHRGALERVTSALQNQEASDKELTTELERLKKQPGAEEPTPAAYLSATADLLDDIRKNRPRIDQAKTQLVAAVKSLDDPVRFEREFRAKELNAKVRQLVEAGEIPDALAALDDLYDLVKQDEIKERRNRLAREWDPPKGGAEHAKARDYIMNTWRATTTLAEFKAAQEPLADAAATLMKHEDRLGLRNLVTSFELAYARLKAITDGLDPNAELDKPQIKDVQAIAQALSKLETDARAAVRKIEGPTGAPEKEP